MDETLRNDLTNLLHDTAFFIMGIEVATGRNSNLISRLSEAIDKINPDNNGLEEHEE